MYNLDINECLIRGVCRTDQRCRNTEGAYQCIDDCPQGMEKRRGVCVGKFSPKVSFFIPRSLLHSSKYVLRPVSVVITDAVVNYV